MRRAIELRKGIQIRLGIRLGKAIELRKGIQMRQAIRLRLSIQRLDKTTHLLVRTAAHPCLRARMPLTKRSSCHVRNGGRCPRQHPRLSMHLLPRLSMLLTMRPSPSLSTRLSPHLLKERTINARFSAFKFRKARSAPAPMHPILSLLALVGSRHFS